MEFFTKIFRFFVVMFALFGFLIFLLIAGGIAAAMNYAKKQELLPPAESILTLTVDGRIVENASRDLILAELIGPPVTLFDVVTRLDEAAADPKVKGLLVRIADHDLSYAQIQELRDAVHAFRRSGKPAVAYADTFGELTRGLSSYYLAAAFDEIYLQPSGMVDISGVAAESVFLKGLLAKIGVEPIGETRKEYKNAWNIFTEEKYTAPHREAVERLLSSTFERLLADIARDRGIDPAALRALIDRAPLFSAEALAERLVTGVKYRDEVLARMEEKAACVRYQPLARYSPSLFDALEPRPTVALIVAEGEIRRGRGETDPFGRRNTIGSDTLAKAVRDAVADPAVKAVVLRVNSPGGSVVASETIWHEVALAAGQNEKPFIVSMGSVAASGGYYISMAADHILAQPATITGSVGVIVGKFYTAEMWKKIGVTFDAAQIGQNARLFSGGTRLDEKQQALLDRVLDDIYDTFVTRAADGRKLKPEEFERHAKGRVWTGEDAKERGLIDGLGGYAEAFAEARRQIGLEPGTPLSFKFYPEEPRFIDYLFDRGGEDEASVGAGLFSDLAAFLRRVGALLALAENIESKELRLESEPVDIR